MRILHIGNVGYNANGVGQVIRQLSAAQKQLGHDVISLTARIKHDELPEFEEIHSKKDFCRLIESFQPDIFIFHSLYIWEYIKFYPLLLKKRIPYLIQLHGALSQENYKKSHFKKWIANQLFYKRFLKKARTIIYLNEAEKQKSIVPFINPESDIIPNGCIIPEYLNKKECDQQHSRRPLRILYIGRLDIYHKALDILTEAIKSYQANTVNPAVEFRFFGIGDAIEVKSFERMISSIGKNVKFLGGVYGEEKEREYRQADIFILTSRSEGMPMGILEALSHGLPCLVTPATNMADIIRANSCGWVVECDKESIATGLEKAINDYLNHHDQLRHNAIVASRQFSWTNIATKSIELYSKFIQ